MGLDGSEPAKATRGFRRGDASAIFVDPKVLETWQAAHKDTPDGGISEGAPSAAERRQLQLGSKR
jgi:hypothetical protein